jgi:hypothetical protein
MNDSIAVTGFDSNTESFKINSPIASHYKISTGQFCTLKNGVLTPIGITTADPDIYRKWLNGFKQ